MAAVAATRSAPTSLNPLVERVLDKKEKYSVFKKALHGLKNKFFSEKDLTKNTFASLPFDDQNKAARALGTVLVATGFEILGLVELVVRVVLAVGFYFASGLTFVFDGLMRSLAFLAEKVNFPKKEDVKKFQESCNTVAKDLGKKATTLVEQGGLQLAVPFVKIQVQETSQPDDDAASTTS